MEGNLNYKELEIYSRKFADTVIEEVFSREEKIGGKTILEITPIKQINFLILHNLFSVWKDEILKLESPYFDYKQKEVKKSLKEFMNVLSRNISVDKEHLKPFFEKSVKDTLWLLLSPYDYFCNIISPPSSSRIKLKDLEEYSKYIKINSKLFESYLDRLKESGDTVFIDEANRILNEVFANTDYTPEEIDSYLPEFNSILEFNPDRFYSQADQKVEGNAPETISEEENNHVTLNDTLKKEEGKTIADAHEQKKIISLKDTLSINQKFMFINQLFDGSVEDFNKIVDFIDQSNSFEEASNFIQNNYIKKNSWKKDSSEVNEFMAIIEKRFIAT